jgi:A/G-specific adenine glycosylase
VTDRLDHGGISHALEAWFKKAARDLPWRRVTEHGTRDPYHAMVSEAMLQQTQVSRVEPKFLAFIARFPTVESLAEAPEDDVLAMWSGLGYYRRARSLHTAAKQIVADHGGVVPSDVTELLKLKGVGRYTAGAIASIVFDKPEPIVDGNVQRVVRRLRNDPRPMDDADAERDVWRDAEQLAQAAESSALTNEAMMELGATVCTKHEPACGSCPLRAHCAAADAGTAGRIPPAKRKPTKRELFHDLVLVRDAEGRLLVEQRPDNVLWAGLWQPVGLDRDDRPSKRAELVSELGVRLARQAPDRLTHQTTHRTVRIAIYRGSLDDGTKPARGSFAATERIGSLALSNPHRRVLLG